MNKIRQIIRTLPVVIGLSILIPLFSFNSGGDGSASATGQASSCGSPGEPGTCSRSTCHGAGSGGLADNAGPGSISLTSVPVINGNQYVPGQVYHMTVTVNETGKTHFGFGIETLDNSGNTDGHVNNTAGTLTVTDATHTRTWQAFGTGRLALTHSINGGLATNTCSFVFDWKAPASGTVNVFLAGNATNNNGVADAADNVYTLHPVYTPLATGISEKSLNLTSAVVYPNPASGMINISLQAGEEGLLQASLYAAAGKLVRQFEKQQAGAGMIHASYSISEVPAGLYFLKIGFGNESETRALIIR